MPARIMGRLTFKQLVLRLCGALAVAAFLAYGTFEARKLIEGPQITLDAPLDGSAVGGPIVTVRGTVRNAAFFTIDGKQALSDEKGDFEYLFSPPPGIAIIEVAARDRFDRTTIKDVEITVLAECLEQPGSSRPPLVNATSSGPNG